jgi:hypothetical protein
MHTEGLTVTPLSFLSSTSCYEDLRQRVAPFSHLSVRVFASRKPLFPGRLTGAISHHTRRAKLIVDSPLVSVFVISSLRLSHSSVSPFCWTSSVLVICIASIGVLSAFQILYQSQHRGPPPVRSCLPEPCRVYILFFLSLFYFHAASMFILHFPSLYSTLFLAYFS